MDAARDTKDDEEAVKRARRQALRDLNLSPQTTPNRASLDSSLKRHNALIKRTKLSIGLENREQNLKDIETLTLEKHVEEIAASLMEGLARCKTDKDIWAATEVISAVHRRLGSAFTPRFVNALLQALAPPPRNAPPSTTPEIQEKEVAARITRQRPVLRVSCELALVGIIGSDKKSAGEWIMKTTKDLLSHDASLSSVPLLITFLKAYGRPFLGIHPTGNQDTGSDNEPEELIDKEIRDRFKRMCEGYYENVAKILVKEHKRLQEQDKRNHEAYIRSGEIFEDRQQAYEKMTRSYEKLLANCQTLSELLNTAMPTLPTAAYKSDSIGLSTGERQRGDDFDNMGVGSGSQWEDEEERKFYEDIIDLKDWVPRSFLNIQDGETESATQEQVDTETSDIDRLMEGTDEPEEGTEYGEPESRPVSPSTNGDPVVAPGPSQVLTGIMGKLPEATSRDAIDQVAIEFMYVNSKAARKRLVKFLVTSPKQRTDLIPYYGRLVATISKYAPDLAKETLVAIEDEFRYLQRKRKVVKELSNSRARNILWFSVLTKFRLVPPHVILHILRVFLDDLTGTNVDGLAALLEGCGRFLLRGAETGEKTASMLELMKRKQSVQNFDQRQSLLLENAYYQCNPPERGPIEYKQRSVMEQFIRHLLCDVLTRKTLDNVLKMLRKLHWDDEEVLRILFKMFSKPWKVSYSSITLMAILAYDLQRYHSKFCVDVVDQVLENIRFGMEQNLYKQNQKRVATVKYLGELYIYRLVNSRVIFDTLWSLVTFGHHEGRPLPGQISPIDAPDDFFRIRLVCTLLDACGMCFDRGSYKRKLDRFLTFFQLYILTKAELPMDVDFMLTDTIEQLRPKMTLYKTFEEAAAVVDEMFESTKVDADDSGDESGDDEERPEVEEHEENNVDDEVSDRPNSPDHLVLLDARPSQGPTEEEAADFDKEFSKMLSDAAADSKKVDKRAVLSAWDTGVAMTGGLARRKKDSKLDEPQNSGDMMRFMVLSKKANKNPTRELEIPTSSAIAAHTLSAQMESKQEQEQLKRLVLDYEHREELAEMREFESSMRSQGIRVRFGS
ncbi:ARM repeat-containing protein [Serendipita vermifera]|nr:ARM repeat-containing protein [Serendipita vermifera]